MRIILFVLLAMITAGCSTSPPTIQEGPDAEVSHDGLHMVDNSRFASAWADPSIDFSRYSKVIPGGAEFEFRATERNAGTTRARSSAREFWISDANKERLIEETSAIFAEELANSTRFTVTDTTGDDVIIIRGAMLDIVSRVPPEMVGRGDVFLSDVGEMTIVIEVVDSMSNAVIFRGVERRAAGRSGNTIRASQVTTWAEVRRLARRWATTLREGLDSIPNEG
jgi:hypothetical protein